MRRLGDILNSKKVIPTQTEVETGLPVRAFTQKSLYLHNKYLEDGYMAAFPSTTTLVYCVLAKYANARTQRCFPAYETIAREAGVHNRQTISTALRILEACGLIYIRHGKGGNTPNVYVLLEPSNWQLPDSVTVDTLRKKRRSIKKASPKYQNDTSGSSTDDTGTPLRDSPKEIPENAPLKEELAGRPTDQESATEIESPQTEIPASTKAMLGRYFTEEQLHRAAADAIANGHCLTSRQVLAAARRLGFEPSLPLPGWYRY
jgi:hypothetical protein